MYRSSLIAMMSSGHQTKINDLLHRLQSLEVDLHEALRGREISESDYSERLDRLRNALGHAQKIKVLMAPAKIQNNPLSQVDLPVMGDYSRMEQKIVTKFVSDMKKKVSEVSSLTQRAAEWTQSAAIQSSGWLRSIWRLSIIRRQLLKVEQELTNVRKARDVVEDFIARAEIGQAGDAKIISQRDLMSAFSEFERGTEKVTALRARVRSETSKNDAMRAWLKSLEIERRSKNPEKATPELSDVIQATNEVSDRLTGGAKLANERLVIARQVIKELKKHQYDEAQSTFIEREEETASVLPVAAKAKLDELKVVKKKTKKRYRGNRL
jgi:hypothetical protein